MARLISVNPFLLFNIQKQAVMTPDPAEKGKNTSITAVKKQDLQVLGNLWVNRG
jgi:hypothetical protein